MLEHVILIVDDDENVLNSIKRIFHDEKIYEAITARSAEDGLKIISKIKVSLIICDYRLKDMSGIDFLEKVKKEWPDIIAVLLTAHADLSVAINAVNKTGVYKFLTKPWNNTELMNAVKSALENKGMHKLKKIRAQDIMSKFAITIRDNDYLVNAAHLMMRFKISGVPVLSFDGKLVGIITATDLFRVMGESIRYDTDTSLITQNRDFVKDVMTKEVMTVPKDMTLYEIINITFSKNIHTLPVVEDDEIVGVIGRRDIINTFYTVLASLKK